MPTIEPQMYKGKALPLRMCGHPEWLSVHKPKPPPCYIRYHCACGENWDCPECGWGAGTWPCTCMRERQAEEAKLNQNPQNPYSDLLVASPLMTPGAAAMRGTDGKIHFMTGLEDDIAHLA